MYKRELKAHWKEGLWVEKGLNILAVLVKSRTVLLQGSVFT